MEYLDSIDGKYGPVRMSGTLGYAVMAIIVGAVATRKLTHVFWVFAVPTVMAMALLAVMPTVKGHYTRDSKVSFLTLFKQKELVMLTAIGLLFQSTSGFFHSFFSLYFINDLGGSLALLGIITSFSAFAEIPFLLPSPLMKIRKTPWSSVSGPGPCCWLPVLSGPCAGSSPHWWSCQVCSSSCSCSMG